MNRHTQPILILKCDVEGLHIHHYQGVLSSKVNVYTLRKKGTKAVTVAVPFQKVHFCTQKLHIGTLVVHFST